MVLLILVSVYRCYILVDCGKYSLWDAVHIVCLVCLVPEYDWYYTCLTGYFLESTTPDCYTLKSITKRHEEYVWQYSIWNSFN